MEFRTAALLIRTRIRNQKLVLESTGGQMTSLLRIPVSKSDKASRSIEN